MSPGSQNIAENNNLFRRFTIASLIIMILGMVGIGWWVGDQIRIGVIQQTASTTVLYMDSFISPDLQELKDSNTLTSQHITALGALLSQTELGKSIVAFKVWSKDGTILYSTTQSLIGRRFTDEDEVPVAYQGRVVASITDLAADENVEERKKYKQLLQIYAPVRLIGSNQIIAVAEFYQTVDDLNNDIAEAQRLSWLVVASVMLLIYLALIGFIRGASNTIQRQGFELTDKVKALTELINQNHELSERVRRAAANTTSHNEHFLRRISAELHDGPAQEIGLALMCLDLAMTHQEESAKPETESNGGEQLTAIQTLLQLANQELRTIASGLGLPQLDDLTLEQSINRAVTSHERRTGTKVSQKIEALPEHASLPVKITTFRLIQEALTNAHRHGGGIQQTVTAGMEGYLLVIEVSDAGHGFDTSQPIDWDGHLGLTGMRERVESLGGLFHIESSENKGTKMRAMLPMKRGEEDGNG